MNRDKNKRSFSSQSEGAGRSPWRKPALVRLQAGAAESAQRQVISDGPLSVKS
jgi:hypothetical protein